MAWKIGVTKFRHKLWGEGVLKEFTNSVLVIDFGSHGIRKLASSAVESGLLTQVVEESTSKEKFKANDSHVKQYDSALVTIGGKNVIESFSRQEHSIFNESYVIIGSELQSTTIQASYDLIVVGDVDAYEISVNGNLTVIGNLQAQKVSCLKNLICQGFVEVEDLYIGGNIICDSIKTVNMICDGNAIVSTTIDIDKSSRTERTMVACEGIMGAGKFEAQNAIANEYFEFAGDIAGNIVELGTNTTLSELTIPEKEDPIELTLDTALTITDNLLLKELDNVQEWNEEDVVEFLKNLSNHQVALLSNANVLFDALINISYKDEIVDFGDYLTAIYAQKVLPKAIHSYESIEHIYSLLIPQAKENVSEMPFIPESPIKIASCLRMIELCSDCLDLSVSSAYDKIFSSIGLKYTTVTKAISNNIGEVSSFPRETIESVSDEVPAEESPKKPRIKKDEFLRSPLHVIGVKFGLTNDEIQNLSSVKIRTCEEFISVREDRLRIIFKKKQYMVNHIMSVQQKMIEALNSME